MQHSFNIKSNIMVSFKITLLLLNIVTSVMLTSQQAHSKEVWIPDINICNKLPTTIEIVDCINQRTKFWDSKLNQTWKILTDVLENQSNKDQYALLKTSQRLWIEYKGKNCHSYAAEQGTISQIDSAECMRRMTQDRAIELQLAGPQN